MAFNQVRIYHGPCTTFHSMEYKPQFVTGMRDRLQKLGYQIDVIEVPYINFCMLAMCDHEVFRCKITNLKFNTCYVRDGVAERAIAAVLHASKQLKSAHTRVWLRELLYDAVFNSTPYSPKDYWPVDVCIKPYTTCKECVICCDVLVARKELTDAISDRCFGYKVGSQTGSSVKDDDEY